MQMRYSLRQLQYFIAAAETGSIKLASEYINISQPSISTAISHLERELGVQLFLRHHAQGLSLTSIGETILREAKAVITQADAIYNLASDLTEEVRGKLSVGCMITLAPIIMPQLLSEFTQKHPNTMLRPIEGNQRSLIEGLRSAEIDAAITYDAVRLDPAAMAMPGEIEFIPLASLPPYVLLPVNHPLATRISLTLADVRNEPMILLDLPFSSDAMLQLFENDGYEPKVSITTPNIEMLRSLVGNGYGFAILHVQPKCDISLDGKQLVRVPLAGNYRRPTIGLAFLSQIRKTKLLQEFASHCIARITDDHIPGMTL